MTKKSPKYENLTSYSQIDFSTIDGNVEYVHSQYSTLII